MRLISPKAQATTLWCGLGVAGKASFTRSRCRRNREAGEWATKDNARLIESRIEAGLARLGGTYVVTECAVDPVLANPVIGARPHHARRSDITGLGSLLAMSVTEADENQLSSFVITP